VCCVHLAETGRTRQPSRAAMRVGACAVLLPLLSHITLATATDGGDMSTHYGTLHRLRIFVVTWINGLSATDHARFDVLLAAASFLCIPCAAITMGYYLRWSCCPGEWQRVSDARLRAAESEMV